MRSLVVAIIVVLLVNLLLIGAGVGYLAATDRLSGERVRQAIDLFKPTLAEQQAAAEEAQRLAEEESAKQQEALRLAEVADGPMTLEDRLVRGQQLNEVLAQQSERLKREQADIIRQIEAAKSVIQQRREEIDQRQEAFEQRVAEYEQQRQDDDFQQAVAMLEQLKPKQAKQVFQSMLANNNPSLAVMYLSAMNPRKAGAVLKEFKAEDEVSQAKMLIEGLRQQGAAVAGVDDV